MSQYTNSIGSLTIHKISANDILSRLFYENIERFGLLYAKTNIAVEVIGKYFDISDSIVASKHLYVYQSAMSSDTISFGIISLSMISPDSVGEPTVKDEIIKNIYDNILNVRRKLKLQLQLKYFPTDDDKFFYNTQRASAQRSLIFLNEIIKKYRIDLNYFRKIKINIDPKQYIFK